jgi:hypothetical protein
MLLSPASGKRRCFHGSLRLVDEALSVYLGGSVFAGSPADFGRFIAEETEKWGKVIRAVVRHVVTNPTGDNGPVHKSGNLRQASILSGLKMKLFRCSEAFQSAVSSARARAAALID